MPVRHFLWYWHFFLMRAPGHRLVIPLPPTPLSRHRNFLSLYLHPFIKWVFLKGIQILLRKTHQFKG